MKITIIGTGYVGLITGISLSLLGHKVICVDNIAEKIEKIKNGRAPFYEPGLEKILKKVLKNESFEATTNLEESVLNSEVIIIAVGTPTINKKIDLSFIEKVSEQIGKALEKTNKYKVIAVKSTVLPGVTEKVVKPILEKYSKKKTGEFGLCMNPEFLREGSALDDALNPDRIVIGQIDPKSGKTFAKIYESVDCPKLFTNLSTAEMTKYAANALFATLISYSNEIARISENIDRVDVVDVWKGVHLDKRLSPLNGKKRLKPGVLNYIFSGCGYGGSCFPKDTKALGSFAQDIGVNPMLINSVIEINRTQPKRIIDMLKKSYKDLSNKRIAILGLSFKPNSDDIRESAAFPVIKKLLKENAEVFAHDPMAYKTHIPKDLGNLKIKLAETAKEAIENSDAVVIITAWEEYIALSPQDFKKMRNQIIIDGRRIYNKDIFIKAGIRYQGIGLA